MFFTTTRIKIFNENNTISKEKIYTIEEREKGNYCDSEYEYNLRHGKSVGIGFLNYELIYFYTGILLDSIQFWHCETSKGWTTWNTKSYIMNTFGLPIETKNTDENAYDYYDKFIYYTRKKKR